MKKIRSYTSIWSVEKVLYSINDFKLPFPITFTQMAWFVVSVFAVMLLGNLPPLSFGVLPVNRTIKNNKFLYRQPNYGWRYFYATFVY